MTILSVNGQLQVAVHKLSLPIEADLIQCHCQTGRGGSVIFSRTVSASRGCKGELSFRLWLRSGIGRTRILVSMTVFICRPVSLLAGQKCLGLPTKVAINWGWQCMGIVELVGCWGLEGVHRSRRCVKCHDHAWAMLSKLKWSPEFQKVV